MELFPWDQKYSVNIQQIDEQHKRLLKLVNELHQGLVAGQSRQELHRIFAGLLDYALQHFKTEEELMSAHHYPGFEEHRQEHDEFRRQIVRFLDAFFDANSDVAMDMIHYLVGWLRSHVFLTDKKYSTFLNERGVR